MGRQPIKAHGRERAVDAFGWTVTEGEEPGLRTDVVVVVGVQLKRPFDMRYRQFRLATIETGTRDGIESRAVGIVYGGCPLCQAIGAVKCLLGCIGSVRLVLVDLADRKPGIGRGVVRVGFQRALEMLARFDLALFGVTVQALAAP